MELRIENETEANVVYISGRVDTASASELEFIVKPLYDETKSLIFDCSAMDYISSSGLRIILASHKKMVAKGFLFILRHINKEVRSVIDMTGFSRILTIEE